MTDRKSDTPYLDELIAQIKDPFALTEENLSWLDAPAVGREKLTPYASATDLPDDKEITFILVNAQKTGDAHYFDHAREVAERARAMYLAREERAEAFRQAELNLRFEGLDPTTDASYEDVKARVIAGELTFAEGKAEILAHHRQQSAANKAK